jgi:hypothetical protein
VPSITTCRRLAGPWSSAIFSPSVSPISTTRISTVSSGLTQIDESAGLAALDGGDRHDDGVLHRVDQQADIDELVGKQRSSDCRRWRAA